MSATIPARTIFADAHTGEISESVKAEAAEFAQRLVDEVWEETQQQYNVSQLTALHITSKVVNAVLSGAVKEHVDILAEPLKPRQAALGGM
jgi:hypothetical protein